uniref:Arylsulfatase B n=1 Tax=Culex pipiens TaxID=7175 RepID=A0A8D8FHS4_CULPI
MWKLPALLGLLFVAVLSVFGEKSTDRSSNRPNIVVIIADDLGWNDVSFHGSLQIPTPNIDALAYSGIILNRHYAPPLCTPSRASLMTGKHPINIGMQHHVIEVDEPWGLGLDQKLMPEYFREAGYRTRLVGKWHLGFFRKAYTPTMRGFDSHYGYIGPYIDYWDHSLQMSNTSTRGLDMRRNLQVDYTARGTYATDLFTREAVRLIHDHNQTAAPLFLVVTHLAPHTGNEDDPMQAPEEDVELFSFIKDPKRRVLAAMISKLDDGVGQIVQALKKSGMLNNTVVLFYADNGAPTIGKHSNGGSNFPLRGQKYSPWEGAVRTAAAIWSPLLNNTGRVSNQWIHVSDWLPTLARAAGIEANFSGSEIDGQNQWEALNNPNLTGRTTVMHNIDQFQHYSSYTKNGWKFVNGTSWDGAFDDWMGSLDEEDELSEEEYSVRLISSVVGRLTKVDLEDVARIRRDATVHCPYIPGGTIDCEPQKSPCLFNILEDPCETNNIANQRPDLLKQLGQDVERYRLSAAEPRNQPADPYSDPRYYNRTWTWWQDELDEARDIKFPLAIFIVSITFIAIMLIVVKPILCPSTKRKF